MNIGVFRFQPFPSRRRATLLEDYVMGMRFTYNPQFNDVLKRILRKYDDDVRDPARRIRLSGSWLDDYRAWYVESGAWQKVKADLQRAYPNIQFVIMPAPPTPPQPRARRAISPAS